MNNENIIQDTSIAYDILKNITLVMDSEAETTKFNIYDFLEKITIDYDKKRYIMAISFDKEQNLKISAIYKDKYGMEIFSENQYNPNGVIRLDIGKVPQTFIFTIMKLEILNTSYSAIQTINANCFNEADNPTRKKEHIENAYIKYYANEDINFNAVSVADLLKEGATPLEISEEEKQIIFKDDINYYIYNDNNDNGIENITMNVLKNNKDKIYFGLGFYEEKFEDICQIDDKGALQILDQK